MPYPIEVYVDQPPTVAILKPETEEVVLPTTGRYMHVPYRSMLPKAVKGLLVTGRAIGGDRIAHAATRNMACCAVAGQGAGIAAARAVHEGHELDTIAMSGVHAELGRQGVRFR